MRDVIHGPWLEKRQAQESRDGILVWAICRLDEGVVALECELGHQMELYETGKRRAYSGLEWAQRGLHGEFVRQEKEQQRRDDPAGMLGLII